jgi:hypothetical protein
VPAVGPWVHGNAVRAGFDCNVCRTRDAGNTQRARVSQQRNFIQVDT